jgi:hypothetical protein
MTQQIQITIHPNVYLADFQQRITADLATLRHTLRGIEDGSLAEKSQLGNPNAVLALQIAGPNVGSEYAVALACNRCFLDITRDLITFIDRILTVKRLRRRQLPKPREVSSVEDLKQFMADLIENEYQNVAQDRSLSNPKKVDALDHLGQYERELLKSYFQLRRCLEHHGQVTTDDLTVHFLRLVLKAGEQEIDQLPFLAPANTGIQLSCERGILSFSAGEKVALHELDVEKLYYTLHLWIGPQIAEVAGSEPEQAEAAAS